MRWICRLTSFQELQLILGDLFDSIPPYAAALHSVSFIQETTPQGVTEIKRESGQGLFSRGVDNVVSDLELR